MHYLRCKVSIILNLEQNSPIHKLNEMKRIEPNQAEDSERAFVRLTHSFALVVFSFFRDFHCLITKLVKTAK